MKKIKFNHKALLAGVLVCFMVSSLSLSAEIIKLKGNNYVKGEIISQNSKRIVVDLGFDLLKIPRTEILEIVKALKSTKSEQQNKNSLYTASNLSEVSTSEGVQNFAPAVVLVRTPGGLGSGFFVNKKGYLVTNFHVIKGQKHITITRYKRTKHELQQVIHKKVRIIALDPFHDLAILKVDDKLNKSLVPAVFSAREDVVVGEKVFVIGNPLGLERTVTEGVVSHSGRNFAGKVFLQIDASVNPGNSGGPLFNRNGEIIGVVNMGARAMQGLNFAIPSRHVKFLLNNIEAFAYSETNSESGYIYPPAPFNPRKKR